MKYQLSLKLRLTKWLFLSLVALASVFGSNAKAAPPACVSAPSGLVGWWPAEGDANDVFGANNGMLENVTFTNGMVGQGFYLNGSNADVQIPDSASLKPASVTVETWVRLDALASPVAAYPGLQYIVFKQNTRDGSFEGYDLEKNLTEDGQDVFRFQVTSADGTQVPAASTTIPQIGVWYHLAGTYDSSSGYVNLYVNGVLEGSAYAGFPLDYGTRPVFIGTTGQPGWDGRMQGTVDEVSIYNRALSSDEIASIYSAGSAGKCPPTPPQPCAPAPTGLVGWWPGEGNANNIIGTNNGVTQNITYTNGEVGQAFVFDGSSSGIRIPANPNLDVGQGNGFTLEAWINPSALIYGGFLPPSIFEWNTGSGSGDASVGVQFNLGGGGPGTLAANVQDTTTLHRDISSATGIMVTNVFQHVALTYDKTTGVTVLYRNGVVVATANLGVFTPQTSFDLYLGKRQAGPFAPFYFAGMLDEASLYNRALTASEIQAIYAAGSGGKCYVPTPPATNVPVIFAFSPISGAVGTNVTISGTNFSPVVASNIVYLGAVQAAVTAASETNLVVTVPPGATYAPITETVNGLTAYANQPFLPTFNGDGSGITVNAFAPQLVLPAGSNPNKVVIADLDGDGKPDLIVLNDDSISLYQNISTNGSLTDGSFAPRVDLVTPGSTAYGLAVADVDGDGKLDIIVPNYGANIVSVYRNTCTPGNISANSFATRVDFSTGAQPQNVAVADIDGDGKPDLVVANNGDGTVSILRNTSVMGSLTTNSFAPKVDIATGSGCQGVAVGDLDGDGKPDVVTANNGNGTLSLLRNISTPGSITANSFAAKVDIAVLSDPVNVAIGDLDGDGKPDLAVTFYLSQTVSVFRNISIVGSLTTNSFAPEIDFPLGGRGHTPAIADLDGDGKPDIAVVTELDSLLSIFRNVSTPGSFTNSSFAGRVDFSTGDNAWGVAIGDLDGDGRPDIVFCNQYDDTISIYQNVMPFGSGSAWDHFAWDSIPSPRFVNTPFSVTLQAQDQTNGLFTNFTGTAILGTTNGVVVTPSVSGNFVQGVWTGSVVISQAVSNLVLQANDGFGHFGLANPINIINLPSLGMWRSGNIALFMWPVGYSGFVLETSGNLSPASWMMVPYAPFQFGDECFLPLNMTGTNGFYRLRFPGP